MAAVNSVSSSRLGLPSFSSRAVLMYSAALAGEGAVALQLREASPSDVTAAAGPLAGIACHDPELLADILHAASDIGECDTSATLASLLDECRSPDRKDTITSLSTENTNGTNVCRATVVDDRGPVVIKRVRTKPASPNRQGPQQCQVCSKVFGNASALAKHKLTHSDERKYVCPMCSKAFKRQDHLNGHMLTHRNKKPYECKADGCGKSYCDARSLRRHTENHHHHLNHLTSNEIPVSKNRNSSCVQINSTEKPTIPARTTNTVKLPTISIKNECEVNAVDKSSKSSDISPVVSPSCKTFNRATSKTPPTPKSKSTWTLAIQHGQSKNTSPSNTSSVVSSTNISSGGGGIANKTIENKPVECNLCHRKFKNIPALNGHMRLHGGYFKKDSDSKKCDKKDSGVPPLQTASVSVRALIEEKIISRRGANTTVPSADTTRTGFISPAPPTSDARTSTPITLNDQFVPPRAPIVTSPGGMRDSTLIELLKRGTKSGRLASDSSLQHTYTSNHVPVKRCASDPGHVSPNQIALRGTEFSFGVSLNPDDGYYSPALTDDAFQFSNTPENLEDIASLEDYATVAASIRDRSPASFPSNCRLQAVLNSPLPEGIADFSTYHTTDASPKTVDVYGDTSLSYPTPPASHEARSPSTMPPRTSSPLSAAFYTATMSSAEEVEEALEEILPDECADSLDVYEALEEPATHPTQQQHQFPQSRMMSSSDDPLLSSSPRDFADRRKVEFGSNRLYTITSIPEQIIPCSNVTSTWTGVASSNMTAPVLQVEVGDIKVQKDVFLSPNRKSPQRNARKRTIDETSDTTQPIYKSKLRLNIVSRHYTPSPILDPNRIGTGLFNNIAESILIQQDSLVQSVVSLSGHINIGEHYQAVIPEYKPYQGNITQHNTGEQLLWDPGIDCSLDDNEVRLFLELSVCAAMPAGGCSRELALRVLADCAGDVRVATLRLMSDHTLHANAVLRPPPRWNPDEVEHFLMALREHDKDFYKISQHVVTKTSKECVQFYYFWKKVTKDYKSMFLRSSSPESKIKTQQRGPYSSAYSPSTPYESEEFPCKICGKKFNKVKSRSAHMKSHRPPDAESKRTKTIVQENKPDERTEQATNITGEHK